MITNTWIYRSLIPRQKTSVIAGNPEYGSGPYIKARHDKCEMCPPLEEWPIRSLILSLCPVCYAHADEVITARMLRARQLILTRGDP